MRVSDDVLGLFLNFFTLSAVVKDATSDDQRKKNESADAKNNIKGVASLVCRKDFSEKGFFLLHFSNLLFLDGNCFFVYLNKVNNYVIIFCNQTP